jgi:hypothetical protein
VDALSGFARHWLGEQEAFWEAWARRAKSDAGFARAQVFWDRACERWLSHVAPSLPPPLDAQARAAVEQTRLYMRLARELSSSDGVDDAVASTLEQAMQDALSSIGSHWLPPPGPDGDATAAERRAVAAYAALMQRLAEIAASALESAREQVLASGGRSPDAYLQAACDAMEAAYLEQARSDEFARDLGEWVNARVALFEPDDDVGDPGTVT